jgi:hypothetical protein
MRDGNGGHPLIAPRGTSVGTAPYTRRVIPVTSHVRPRALQYKTTMTRTRACCSAVLWVSARSATARPSCTGQHSSVLPSCGVGVIRVDDRYGDDQQPQDGSGRARACDEEILILAHHNATLSGTGGRLAEACDRDWVPIGKRADPAIALPPDHRVPDLAAGFARASHRLWITLGYPQAVTAHTGAALP